MAQTAENVFRDFVTDGVASSGANKVKKAEARELFAGYEAAIRGFQAGGGVVFQTKAAMTLTYAANQMAWVIGDSTDANNGVYQKQGGSGAGSWLRVADLPYSFIKASNAGAGTANAIAATTSTPIPAGDGVALITVNVTTENTGPVTVSFNGGPALNIVTSSGNAMLAGYLKPSMMLAGFKVGSSFRLLSDIASAAIVAEAEAVLSDIKAHHLGAFANDTAASASVGGAPTTGALYFNTTAGKIRVWTGVAWQDQSVALNDGDVTFPKLATSLVQADGDASPDEDSDVEIPTVKRVRTLIERFGGSRLTPFQFGALPDGSDSRAALLEAFAEMDATGKPLDLGSYTWTITDTLQHTFARRPKIYADGATIKLNRGASAHVARAVNFLGNFGGDFRGWKVDANRQAYNGLVVFNTLASNDDADLHDVMMEFCGAENTYRSGTDHLGGFGIWVWGAHRFVHLDQPKVKNICVANGAAIMSSIGAHGIAVGNNGEYEPRDILIENPWVEEVYSEDPAYVFDQDGIQIFRAPPLAFATVSDRGGARVSGGMFINCRGRGIKVASVNARVEGAHFERTDGDFTGRGFTEVDFQYGEGVAKDITYHHEGHSTEKIVSVSAGEYASSGLLVDNLRGFIETANTPRPDYIIMRYTPATYAASPTVVKNCVHQGDYPDAYLYHKSNKTSASAAFETVTVENVAVSLLGNAMVRRDGGTVQAIVRGCSNAGASVPTVQNMNGATTSILPASDRGNIGLT